MEAHYRSRFRKTSGKMHFVLTAHLLSITLILLLFIADGRSARLFNTQSAAFSASAVTGLPVRTSFCPDICRRCRLHIFQLVSHHIRSRHIDMQEITRRDKHSDAACGNHIPDGTLLYCPADGEDNNRCRPNQHRDPPTTSPSIRLTFQTAPQ